MHSQSLLTSVLAAVATAVLAPRSALAQSNGSYLGCYVDAGSTGTRTLNYGAYTASNNTNELCQSACFGLGYAYSGTEYGIQVCRLRILLGSVDADGRVVLLRQYARLEHRIRRRLQRRVLRRCRRVVRRKLAVDGLLDRLRLRLWLWHGLFRSSRKPLLVFFHNDEHEQFSRVDHGHLQRGRRADFDCNHLRGRGLPRLLCRQRLERRAHSQLRRVFVVRQHEREVPEHLRGTWLCVLWHRVRHAGVLCCSLLRRFRLTES
jgi:hypothetical protein